MHPQDKYDYEEARIFDLVKRHGKTWNEVKDLAAGANGDEAFRKRLQRARKNGHATGDTFIALARAIGCPPTELVEPAQMPWEEPVDYHPKIASFMLELPQGNTIVGEVWTDKWSGMSQDHALFEVQPTRLVIEFFCEKQVNIELCATANDNLTTAVKVRKIGRNRFEILHKDGHAPLPLRKIISGEIELFHIHRWYNNSPIEAVLGIQPFSDLLPVAPDIPGDLNLCDLRKAAVSLLLERHKEKAVPHESNYSDVVLSHQLLNQKDYGQVEHE